jgi:hypothetical protein
MTLCGGTNNSGSEIALMSKAIAFKAGVVQTPRCIG